MKKLTLQIKSRLHFLDELRWVQIPIVFESCCFLNIFIQFHLNQRDAKPLQAFQC